ncbi:copper chaperone PCu(A)C [Haloechinothrix sp. LS1_15]|uniref:copper chaperone PCu(A)C n=1 Tax=Haloechinothrix sp. LS1_15 TaxID=2652248 RepID=UPI002945C11A|nr:copper chaperone PCu(A)C [Haloechinothrix sp. LS1_15]MDV6013634.1 copper chaperone PCu(A)C [Haloechinothrix sp. LS1_15]
MTHSPVVVLLGRGMPKGEQRAALQRTAESLLDEGVTGRAEVAFLEMTAPGLQDVLLALAAEGEVDILVIPAFVPFDRNIKAWLPRAISQWLGELDQPPRVRFGPPMESGEHVDRAVRDSVRTAHEAEDVATSVRPMRYRPGSARVPVHRRHVLVCVGPRCVAAGAWEALDGMRSAVARAGVDRGADKALVTRAGCLGPCTMAPVTLVYPEGAWYPNVDAEVIETVVDEHLVGGVPVARLAARSGDTALVDRHNEGVADDPLVDQHVGDIRLHGLYAKRGMHDPEAAAVFGEIGVASGSDTLLSASSELAHGAALHDPRREDSELAFPVPVSAREPISLAPGELHLMLFGAMNATSEGRTVPVRLTFAEAGEVELMLPVHALRAGMNH